MAIFYPSLVQNKVTGKLISWSAAKITGQGEHSYREIFWDFGYNDIEINHSLKMLKFIKFKLIKNYSSLNNCSLNY